MATSGQFYWPPVGSSVAAYGQFGMAANTYVLRQNCHLCLETSHWNAVRPVLVSTHILPTLENIWDRFRTEMRPVRLS